MFDETGKVFIFNICCFWEKELTKNCVTALVNIGKCGVPSVDCKAMEWINMLLLMQMVSVWSRYWLAVVSCVRRLLQPSHAGRSVTLDTLSILTKVSLASHVSTGNGFRQFPMVSNGCSASVSKTCKSNHSLKYWSLLFLYYLTLPYLMGKACAA